MPRQGTNTSPSEMRTESFVIDLFLEKDDVRLTKVLHIGSDADEQWDGWNEEKLSSFLKAQFGRNGKDREGDSGSPQQELGDAHHNGKPRLDQPRSSSSTSATTSRSSPPSWFYGERNAPSVEPATPTNPTPSAMPAAPVCTIVKANFHRRNEDGSPDLSPAPLTTADPFAVELLLAPDKAARGHSYWAMAFARRYGDGGKVSLGAVRGTLEGPCPSAVIDVKPSDRLQPGVYLVWASVVSASSRATVGVGMLELVAPPQPQE